MPTFEIPDGPTTVKVSGDVADPKSPRVGAAVFNVTNKAGETRAGRLSVQVTGETKADWFAIDGERERDFSAGETQTASIKINVPPDVAAGDYAFRLRVVAVNDPDNDHADGPVSTAQVEGPIKKGGVPVWVWILIGLVVLAAVGAGLYFLLAPGEDDKGPDNSIQTNTVEPTTAAVPLFEGKTLQEADAAAEGFELVKIAGAPSGKLPDTIVDQAPDAGQQLTKGFPVKVTYDPGVAVPQLSGDTDQAVRALSRIGLHVASSTSRCEATGTLGEIVDQTPKPPKMVASGSGVDIVIRSRGGTTLRGLRFPCNARIQGVLKAGTFSAVTTRRVND